MNNLPLTKAIARLNTSKEIRATLAKLREIGGFKINENTSAGMIIVTRDEAEVFRAIQKHAGGNWIVRTEIGLLN